MSSAGRGGEIGYKTDDDVRAYVRKRKRANKNCSVSHLRRALNIGYKKAKRIHDEVDDELRRERHERRERGEESRHHPSRATSRLNHDNDGSDDGGEYDDNSREQPHGYEHEGEASDEILREHIRNKLRRGEIIYVHHMRDLGLSYRRTRRIIQEFVDQGKIQKLPKSSLGGKLDSHKVEDTTKMKPLKQKVKEENKKAAEIQLKADANETAEKKEEAGTDLQQATLIREQSSELSGSSPGPSSSLPSPSYVSLAPSPQNDQPITSASPHALTGAGVLEQSNNGSTSQATPENSDKRPHSILHPTSTEHTAVEAMDTEPGPEAPPYEVQAIAGNGCQERTRTEDLLPNQSPPLSSEPPSQPTTTDVAGTQQDTALTSVQPS